MLRVVRYLSGNLHGGSVAVRLSFVKLQEEIMSDKSKPEGHGRLCMTTKVGQSFRIGDAIVTIRRIREGSQAVDVMIVAPKTMYVSRKWPPDPGHEPKQ